MSTAFIDLKYIRMLGAQLLNFKQLKSDLYIFSHDCEDRTRSKVKVRGYIYMRDNEYYMKCHHCGASHKFPTFLKQKSASLADEYRMEMYRENVNGVTKPTPPKKPDFTLFTKSAPLIKHAPLVPNELEGAVPVASLAKSHPAMKYVASRKIPEKYWTQLYFAPKFFEFASKYKTELKGLKNDHPRLIIPYYEDGDVIAFNARAFGDETPKYMFIKVKQNCEYIYGAWRLDHEKPIIAVEGEIDSLFLDNAIAMGGADYNSPFLQYIRDNLIIVPDNDFVRNKQVADSVLKAIRAGYSISLFPEGFGSKDINEAVRKGKYTTEQLNKMILSNKKSGAEAELELIFRRKC